MVRIGFTGTQREPSFSATMRISNVLAALPKDAVLVTGGCVGVDSMVAFLGHRLGFRIHTVLPANRQKVDPEWERWCHTHEQMPPDSTYRARNQRLVEQVERVVAFPHQSERRSPRSGTWMTVRLARKAGKPVEVHILSSFVVVDVTGL